MESDPWYPKRRLASPDIDLGTDILDIGNMLRYEDLDDVALVGSSSGGMDITGVAERGPERIGHLICVDAFVPQDGQSIDDLGGAGDVPPRTGDI